MVLGMSRTPRVILAGLVAAAAATAVAGCTTADQDTAAVTTTQTRPAVTSTTFPEPPPYTHEIRGDQIVVSTSSADPTDLLDTYNTVTRTLVPTLADGGYWVRINCTVTGARLANGHIGVGKLGVAQTGDLGGFDGVVPDAHCP